MAADPLLAAALGAIARDVDAMFDALLPVGGSLAAAMRHAAIGGGKRLRPLLLTATAAMRSLGTCGKHMRDAGRPLAPQLWSKR